MEEEKRHFIFGYGSLLNKESRQSSSPSKFDIIPVKLYGYTRGWFARTGVKGVSTTYLGCLSDNSPYLDDIDTSGFMNGAIYAVNEDELPILDKRERNYLRKQIKADSIVSYYRNPIPENITIWIYENQFSSKEEFRSSLPNRDFPIIQSYVDMCLIGCFEIEEELRRRKIETESFAHHFIKSTFFWDKAWANDRLFPRRPQKHCPKAYEIDKLLFENLEAKIFKNIYIE